MKAYGLLIIIFLITLSSCVEDDPLFGKGSGENTFQGLVLYKDALTGLLDTANAANIVISPQEKPNDKYILESQAGKFRIDFLKNQTYNIDIEYLGDGSSPPSSLFIYRNTESKTFSIPIPSGDQPKEFILSLDDTQDYGLGSLSGRILFKDELSDLNKVATGASIRLKSKVTDKVFSATTNENGQFTISGLVDVDYDFKATYYQTNNSSEPLVYVLDDSTSINKNKNKSRGQDTLVLDTDTLINRFLKITVFDITDNANTRVVNAKVYLFNTENAATANPINTDVAVATDSTNSRGIVLFGDLEPKKYFSYIEVSESVKHSGNEHDLNVSKFVSNTIPKQN